MENRTLLSSVIGSAAVVSSTQPDGATLLVRPSGIDSDQNPAFSPDGKTLLFTTFHHGYNNGDAGIYEKSLVTGHQNTLLNDPGADDVNLPGTSWNGPANRITFTSDRQDKDEIWTIDPKGGHLFRVTRHTGKSHFLEPSFSPDGKWIVFEVDPSAGIQNDVQQGSIFKVAADGTHLTRLTNGPAAGLDDRQPGWSPKGDRIVFQRRRAGKDQWDLYTMMPDGTDLRRVTNDHASNTDASWSPDGRWLTYSSDHGGLPTANVFIISAAGGNPVRVTRNATNEEGAASWSPDGKWIAFESHVAAHEGSPSSLWKIRVPRLPWELRRGRY